MSGRSCAFRMIVLALAGALSTPAGAAPAALATREAAGNVQATVLLAGAAPDQQVIASVVLRTGEFTAKLLRTKTGRALPKQVQHNLLTRPERHVRVGPYGPAGSSVLAVRVGEMPKIATARHLAALVADSLIAEFRRLRAARVQAAIDATTRHRDKLAAKLQAERAAALKASGKADWPSLQAEHASLTMQLEAATAELIRLRLDYGRAKNALASFKRLKRLGAAGRHREVLRLLQSDAVLSRLHEARIAMEAEHDELLERLGPRDGAVVSLEAHLEALRRRITQREKEAAEAAVRVVLAEYEATPADLAGRLADLRKIHDALLRKLPGVAAHVAAVRRIEQRQQSLTGELDLALVRLGVEAEAPQDLPYVLGALGAE